MENVYCKNISVPEGIFKPFNHGKVFDLHVEIALTEDQINPEFVEWLNSYGLDIVRPFSGYFFSAPPGQIYSIHTDFSLEYEKNKPDKMGHMGKINIMYNSTGADMVWYKQKDGGSRRLINNKRGVPMYIYDPDQVEEVYRHNADTPIILNGAIIHTLMNGSTTRHCYSILLTRLGHTDYIKWDELNLLLGDLIID